MLFRLVVTGAAEEVSVLFPLLLFIVFHVQQYRSRIA